MSRLFKSFKKNYNLIMFGAASSTLLLGGGIKLFNWFQTPYNQKIVRSFKTPINYFNNFSVMQNVGKNSFSTSQIPHPYRFLNNLVIPLVNKYETDPKYSLASKFISYPYVFGIFGSESYNRPGFNFTNSSRRMNPRQLPTDVGLGQITQPTLDNAIKNKIVSANTKLFDLTTIMSKTNYKNRLKEKKLDFERKRFYEIQMENLAKKLKIPINQITNNRIIQFNENAVRKNVEVSVFTAYDNLNNFLKRVRLTNYTFNKHPELLTNPRILRDAYLSYKDGARGIALIYKGERNYGKHDLRYANKRGLNTSRVQQIMRNYSLTHKKNNWIVTYKKINNRTIPNSNKFSLIGVVSLLAFLRNRFKKPINSKIKKISSKFKN